MKKLITIGVYGYTADTFFHDLQEAGVQVFCDIRWRRGVRGASYAFANHKRLVARLESLDITYIHIRELAPTPEIRQRQIQADKETHVTKRKRKSLDIGYIESYRSEILASYDLKSFWETLPEGTNIVALFCVEKDPNACHRSLVAEKLQKDRNIIVENLMPD